MRDGGQGVGIRAFRGTRKSSVYREHLVSEGAFARILGVGAKRGLSLLSALDRSGPHQLDKQEARDLVAETEIIRSGGELRELDDELVAIAEVARWCSRAPGESWMKIEGP